MKVTRLRKCNAEKNEGEFAKSSASLLLDQTGDSAKASSIIDRLSRKLSVKEQKSQKKKPAKRNKKANVSMSSLGSTGASESGSMLSQDMYDFDMACDECDLKLEYLPEGKSSARKRKATVARRALTEIAPNKKKSPYTKASPPVIKKLQSAKTTSTHTNKCKEDTGSKKQNKILTQQEKRKVKVKEEKKRPFWEAFSNKPRESGTKRRRVSQTRGQGKVKTVAQKKLENVPSQVKLESVKDCAPIKSNHNLLYVGGSKGSAPSSADSSFVDSGVFMSPIGLSVSSELSMKGRGSLDSVASTPSIILAHDLSPHPDLESTAFDDLNESLVVQPPSVSPVERYNDPQSPDAKHKQHIPTNMGSPDLKSPSIGRTYKNISMSELSSHEKKQKVKKKGRYSTNRLEYWANKMNEQFDEIDNFELSIEEQY